ncbi:NAD(P)-dependent oxidoreductase [Streptomyces sp. 8L]|uniref:NAD(P)-dependent oxidoreductase n=1 Tax=Streptomyces sp. 8L TaxID=2877242 RepID=UPI001CD68918|nr:NAD(P)H-binding protein [Streptomyces sp. 8L]MCA1221433.1 NAD(P)H-binding protein [Streptomyces sp. 8L]
MRVALIGGTGGMGTFIHQEFEARGHALVAVVRRPGAIEPGKGTRVVVADVFEPDALRDAISGSEAVVSAFNPGWNAPDLYERYMRGAHLIQEATKAAAVPRLLVVGGASSLLSEDGTELIEKGLPPEPYASGVRAARDYYRAIRSERELDWVFLSPPLECGPTGPDGRRGTYRVGKDHPVFDAAGKSSLSRQDLALAVADEIERPAHHRERFTVGY